MLHLGAEPYEPVRSDSEVKVCEQVETLAEQRSYPELDEQLPWAIRREDSAAHHQQAAIKQPLLFFLQHLPEVPKQ